MKRTVLLCFAIAAIVAMNGRTVISGNYDGKYVYIFDQLERDPNKSIIIPIKDGKFTYELDSDTVKCYGIQSDRNRSGYKMNFFFSEPVELNVIFTPVEDDGSGIDRGFNAEVIAPEGSLSRRVADLFNKAITEVDKNPLAIKLDSLEKNGLYYTPEYSAVMNMVKDHPELKTDSVSKVIARFYETKTWRTPEAEEVEAQLRKWYQGGGHSRITCGVYATDSTLAGLFLLAYEAWYADNTYIMTDIYEKHFKGRFPGHPYDSYMQLLASSYDPTPGRHFIDFSAPDFGGKTHRLSDLVKGRPALLDLWSSDCFPCRRKSRAMKSVYDKYADRGFTIVGVAREFGSPDGGRKAIAEDGYPWLNLLELDDANNIYARYRCANGLGATFLIDDSGTIVAANPSVEEVEAWLSKYYGK